MDLKISKILLENDIKGTPAREHFIISDFWKSLVIKDKWTKQPYPAPPRHQWVM